MEQVMQPETEKIHGKMKKCHFKVNLQENEKSALKHAPAWPQLYAYKYTVINLKLCRTPKKAKHIINVRKFISLTSCVTVQNLHNEKLIIMISIVGEKKK